MGREAMGMEGGKRPRGRVEGKGGGKRGRTPSLPIAVSIERARLSSPCLPPALPPSFPPSLPPSPSLAPSPSPSPSLLPLSPLLRFDAPHRTGGGQSQPPAAPRAPRSLLRKAASGPVRRIGQAGPGGSSPGGEARAGLDPFASQRQDRKNSSVDRGSEKLPWSKAK